MRKSGAAGLVLALGLGLALAIAFALGGRAPAAAGEPDFFAFSAGGYDVNDDRTAAEFRVEYRSDLRFWKLVPFIGLAGTTDEAIYGFAGLGLDADLALEVARQLTAHDALGAHAEAELGLDPDELTSPWAAAWASMISFTLGALLPLLTISLVVASARVWVTIVAVTAALALTGFVSARLGEAPPGRAVVRNMAGGLFAMLVTFLVGSLLGTRIG